MIRVAEFPELKLLAWNRQEDAELDEHEALALYEVNWRFVDEARLLPHERALIERLKNECGREVLNV